MSNKIDLSGGFNRLQPNGTTALKDSIKPYARSYADAAARVGAVGLVAGDIRTLALQEDTNHLWLLTNHSPVTWGPSGSYGIAFETIAVDTVLTEDQTGYHFLLLANVTVTLPTSPSDGTKFSFAFLGADASILCGGTNTFVGRNDLMFGSTQIRGTTMSGMVVVAKDLDSLAPGMFGWFIEGGQGRIEDFSNPALFYEFNFEFLYTNAAAMPSTVGGWEASSTFSRKTVQEMLDGLLYPYQYPAFSSFGMSGQSTPIEVGASLLVDPDFAWVATNTANIAAGSIEIVDVTGGGTVLVTGLDHGDSPQSVTLAAISKTTALTHTFSITGENSKAGTFTRNAVYTWQWRSFYGESASASLNEAGVEGLRANALAAGFAGTYVFVEDALKYKYIAYAAALGLATTFKDSATLLDIPMEAVATVSIANAYGEPTRTNYNVHRTTNLLGGAINIVVT